MREDAAVNGHSRGGGTAAGLLAGLLLLGSCAIAPGSAAKLPADVKMNKDAGWGSHIFVTLRLEDGEELPFVLDTAASVTCFDKSLAPKLGKSLDTTTTWHFGVKGETCVYAAPRLYLGHTLLQTTKTNVVTLDLKQVLPIVGRRVAGILGIDVLGHYCIQLDFAAHRVRFLDDEHANKSGWGKSFPLTLLEDGCACVCENLAGTKEQGSLVDTGCDGDGWLTPAVFRQWTNQVTLAGDAQAHSPNGLLGGETYTNLDLRRLNEGAVSGEDSHLKGNIIGLRFLARNLVTLDFPQRTMYLTRTSIGPLIVPRKEMQRQGKSVFKFLRGLHQHSQLPGELKMEKLATVGTYYYYSATFGRLDLVRKADSAVCHYEVARASEQSAWKLVKAWRTDKDGATIEEFPVP